MSSVSYITSLQGQLGDNTLDAKSSPVVVGNGLFVSIASSSGDGYHMLAKGVDGIVYAWGYDFGMLFKICITFNLKKADYVQILLMILLMH